MQLTSLKSVCLWGRSVVGALCLAICSPWVFSAWGLSQAKFSEPAAVNLVPEIAQARSELEDRRVADAEQTLRLYLQKQPHSADALYLLGEVMMRGDHAAESLKLFTQASALRSPTGAELRLVGLSYVLLHDNADAILWLTKAAELSPDDPEIRYSLGRAWYASGNYAAAEAAFRKTLTLDVRSIKAEDNLGLSLAAQNKPDLALEAYANAIAWQKGALLQSEQPFLDYGIALLRRGRAAEAVDALSSATAIAPTCAPCHEAAGQALLSLDSPRDAQNEFERATAIEPQNARFHFELGRVYKRVGDAEKSAIELKKSAELYSSHSVRP